MQKRIKVFKLINMDFERYNRHIILPEIGEEGQRRLNEAKVLVIGAGGLGSPVLIYLAAAGIGTLGIVDDDVVSLSNLQRQILYKYEAIGLAKVEQAKQRLLENNPALVVQAYQQRLSQDNAPEIAKGYDIIVDCTDNYASRYLIDDISNALEIPMVYASISKFTGQLSVFNFKASKSYKDLFSEQPQIDKNEASRLGVLGVLPGIIGSMQANEVVKIVLGMEGILFEKLFLMDTRTMQSQIIAY